MRMHSTAFVGGLGPVIETGFQVDDSAGVVFLGQCLPRGHLALPWFRLAILRLILGHCPHYDAASPPLRREVIMLAGRSRPSARPPFVRRRCRAPHDPDLYLRWIWSTPPHQKHTTSLRMPSPVAVTSLNLMFDFILKLGVDIELLLCAAPSSLSVVVSSGTSLSSHVQQEVMSVGPIDDEKLPNTVFGELPLTRQLDEEEPSTLGTPPIAEPKLKDGPTACLVGKLGRP